jgi:hypothetical protein
VYSADTNTTTTTGGLLAIASLRAGERRPLPYRHITRHYVRGPMNSSLHATLPELLRSRMVDGILKIGHARTSVEEALRAVPRHLFVSGASVEDAYADQAVITKRAGDGTALSCASVPSFVATILDQLDVRPSVRTRHIRLP